MSWSPSTLFLTTALALLFLANPAHAFGAGNIASLSRIEGQNWRHGDIEDVLLTLYMARVAGGGKFSKLDVKRVYFGNWLRDYSQAVDVGTVKYVSSEAIRILLWVLGFMSFGFGTAEFEVTTERLGCYQPTEHIDNPLGYADGEDARRYDRRLRGPVNERLELAIDHRTGLKNYIASEDVGIDTSAGLVRRVFGQCIELGRRYGRSGRKSDLYEALRLLGTGLHCLEDYAAHSNYSELSLIELGERDIFPHVGRSTQIQLPGARAPVYPIVTGTFGGVDFLHSVVGEISDKATQSEIEGLEGVIQQSQKEGPSEGFLQQLFDSIPSGVLGGNTDNTSKMDRFEANKHEQEKHSNISPRQPEEWAQYLIDTQRQLYPVLEWHDELVKQIHEAMERIPGLMELIEQVSDQVTVYVYSIMAPYVLPILYQVKRELETGSSEIIQSSKQQQYNTFNDDYCSDPTHSMLSKDHFTNLLNEPSGKIAQEVVRWAVPQIMECWDDEHMDVNRTLTRIIYGVFHHPAQRNYGDDGISEIRQIMFRVVEDWWHEQGSRGQASLRQQLSREGVRNGKNHKPGLFDSGHGCGKPMSLPKKGGKQGTASIGKLAEQAVGGGSLGSLVSGLVGQAGGDYLGLGEEAEKDHKKKEKKEKEYKEKKYRDEYGDYDEKKKYKKKDEHGYGYDDDEKKKYKKKEEYGQGYDDDEKKKYKKKEEYGYGYDDDYDKKKHKKKDKDDDEEKKKYKKDKDYEKEYKKKEKEYEKEHKKKHKEGSDDEKKKYKKKEKDSRERSREREDRHYSSGHYESREYSKRHDSREREYGYGDSYKKRYDDDDDDDSRHRHHSGDHRHHHHHHHRRGSYDS